MLFLIKKNTVFAKRTKLYKKSKKYWSTGIAIYMEIT